jgi:glucose-1-phosphate thymidylyltransferase
MNISKAIFLSAGRGTRLGDETKDKPKPLVKVGSKTLLDHSVHAVSKVGFGKAIFVVGHMSDQIEAHTSKYSFPKSLVTQKELLGTAHAVWVTKKELKPTDSLLVVFPDAIWGFQDKSFLTDEIGNTLFVTEVEDIRSYGEVTRDQSKILKSFREKPEKPKSNLAAAGIYYFREAGPLLALLDKRFQTNQEITKEVYLTEIMEEMVRRGDKIRVKSLGFWHDCGSLADLEVARKKFS